MSIKQAAVVFKMLSRLRSAVPFTRISRINVAKRHFCAPTTKLKMNFHYKTSSSGSEEAAGDSAEGASDEGGPEFENLDGANFLTDGLAEGGEGRGKIPYWPPQEAKDATVLADGNKKTFVFNARRDVDGKREPSVC